MTKWVKSLSDLVTSSSKSSVRPIRIVHLDDLALKVTKLLSGLTHFVIVPAASSNAFCDLFLELNGILRWQWRAMSGWP